MKVPLQLEEKAGLNREREPVTLGVPVGRGDSRYPDRWVLQSGNERIPVQTEVLNRWADGSPKWVLCDFFVTLKPGEKKSCELVELPQKDLLAPEFSIRAKENEGKVFVDTGAGIFVLNPNAKGILSRVDLAGGPGFDLRSSRWVLQDGEGRESFPTAEKITIETKGNLRVCVGAEGSFEPHAGVKQMRFCARTTFYAGLPRVKIDWTVWNPRRARHRRNCWDLGDPGSFLFEELRYELNWEGEEPRRVYWQLDGEDSVHAAQAAPWRLYQESSGGENWNSHNHVNREGKILLTFPGYWLQYGDADLQGKRAQPVVAVSSAGRHIAATMERFWENFPKSIEWDGKNFSLGLFPGLFPDMHELQGGERKTHTLFLNFGSGNPESACKKMWGFLKLICVRLSPEYVAETRVYPWLTLPDEDLNPEYRQWVQGVVEGKDAFSNRRETIDEYGWRHFGCLVADHEAVREKIVSHDNNQYDALYGFLLHHWRTGDTRWLTLAHDLARHTMDIDLYHTREDKTAYNGGFFWHTEHYRDAGLATHRTYTAKPLAGDVKPSRGGGPSSEHNYTTGLLHYYFFTGDPVAKECVIQLANWVLEMEDGKKSRFRFLDRGETGLSSRTAEENYHGPGRGAGNSVNALLDAHILSRERRFLDQAEKLVRRCCHPEDDIQKRKLDQPEIRWSYLMFLQTLGRYLEWKKELGELDRMFFYGRESLLHYARWMVENEKPYWEVQNKVRIWTETWPANDLRKSEVFKYAAIHSEPPLRGRFLEKSKYYYDRSLHDLQRFETRALTRPLVILLVNGVSHGAFHRREDQLPAVPAGTYHFGKPVRFVPQRRRVLRKLTLMLLLLVLGLWAFAWWRCG